MGMETHSSDGSAPCWVAENLQPHSQEKHCRGLWPSAVCKGAFYYPAVLPVVDKLIQHLDQYLMKPYHLDKIC